VIRSPIGFAVLTHRDPPQIARLLSRLRDLYPDSPVALHHDFGKSDLDVSVPAGVQVVTPHLAAGWGTWNIVEAKLAALRLLYRGGDGPEFVAVLSGTDYPVARAARVVADLRAGGADSYLKATPVWPWRRDRRASPGPLGFGPNEGASNQEVCYRRYWSTMYRPLGIRIRVRSPLLTPLLVPFSRQLVCHAGEFWSTLGRRAAEHLLEMAELRPELSRWFAERHIPDEAYVHTVLCNALELRVDRRNFRYVDWTSNTPSPRQLEVADVPRILASGAHFARKFSVDHPALDAIDAALGLPPWRGRGARS